MSAIEELKNELLKQKERIIAKGGSVVVANYNPSPAEITKGIDTISAVDFTLITANSEDVALGKKFYGQDGQIKTGNNSITKDIVQGVFMFEENVSDGNTYNYKIDENVSKIRKSAFENNANKVSVVLHSNITEISELAFAGTSAFSFENFKTMNSLNKIGTKAFYDCQLGGIDFENLTINATNIGDSAFENSGINYADFILGGAITNMGNNVFKQNNTSYQNTLDLTNFKLESTMEGTFYYNFFDCDFTAPSTLKTIGKYFNYNGGFNNIIIPETVSLLDDYCFGADADKPTEYFYLQSVTFSSETPPQIGVGAFASQLAQTDFKIYVPDSAVQAYKNVANLAPFANKIYPISQQ